MENGGRGIIANDEHYGCIENLTAPGRGVNMGDGWETRRRREPGHDWAVLELGAPGRIDEVVVDTAHFKGNYPDRCFLQAARRARPARPRRSRRPRRAGRCCCPRRSSRRTRSTSSATAWPISAPIRFVRLNIIPDGGVSRLRLIGRVAR